jgi:hypothetical protein
VVPDKGYLFGPEYVLPYTIPDFEKKLFPSWERDHEDTKNFISLKFDLFSSCLQGIIVTKWDLCTTKYPNNKRMEKHFNACMKDYLETIAKCTNLGCQVIRWLCLKAKPVHMKFEDSHNCSTQILGCVQKGWLCHRLGIHNDAELCEQVFLAQPKAHRGKYAKKHKVVENNMLTLQEYFRAVTMWTFAVGDINAF